MIVHNIKKVDFMDPENEILKKLAEKIRKIEIELDEDGEFYCDFNIQLKVDDVHDFDFAGRLSYCEDEKHGRKWGVNLSNKTFAYINCDCSDRFSINGTKDVNLDSEIEAELNE